MLSSLREKILNVSLFTNNEEEQSKKKAVNINAGAEILTHFQNQWEDLHKTNEENAKQAERVAKEIECISNGVDKQKENLALINKILCTNLSKNINLCLENIKILYNTSEGIEKDLIELENIIDQVDFEKLKNRHKYHLDQYGKRKEETLVNLKSDLELKHQKKIEEYETSKKALMMERQQVFQDAFKTDLEMYKSLGTIPPKIQQNTQNGALLEEIQLDFDEKELDHFFSEENTS